MHAILKGRGTIPAGLEAAIDHAAEIVGEDVNLSLTAPSAALSHEWRWAQAFTGTWSAWEALPVDGVVSDFPDGQLVRFQARGVGAGGVVGPGSNISTVQIPWNVPGDIVELEATGVLPGSIVLRFGAAASASGYQYRQDGGSWTALTVAEVDGALEGTVTGLSVMVDYDFEVRGINPEQNGPASPVAVGRITSKVAFRAQVNDETDLTTYTFAGVSFGMADADAGAARFVVVGIHARAAASRTFSSVIIGGVAASALGTLINNGAFNLIRFYGALVPTGETGDVVLVFSDTMQRATIHVFSCYGLALTTLRDEASDVTHASGVLLTNTLDVIAGGVALGVACGLTAGEFTWAGLTERADLGASGRATCACDEFAGAQTNMTITCTSPNTADGNLLMKNIALG